MNGDENEPDGDVADASPSLVDTPTPVEGALDVLKVPPSIAPPLAHPTGPHNEELITPVATALKRSIRFTAEAHQPC